MPVNFVRRALLSMCIAPLVSSMVRAQPPELPPKDAELTLQAQPWPLQPGKRTIAVQIHYPGGRLADVDPHTGLMLTLHNWGGTKAMGTADPRMLADRFNVVAISLDYLQSGPHDPAGAPYDFGYLQALDAILSLHFVFSGLEGRQIPFDRTRIYAVGGSGGGNVALMCNKLAPRTFACIVDLSGMAKLNDDIAFNLPGGSSLDAGYSQAPEGPKFLSADAQAIRFVGLPEHLAAMKRLSNSAKVLVVHGADDPLCPPEDAQEMVANMERAKLDVELHLVTEADVDGKIFSDSGHSLGDRGQIVCHVADRYLLPGTATTLKRSGKTDFEFHDRLVRYETPGGRFIISYQRGYPIGIFEPAGDRAKQSAARPAP